LNLFTALHVSIYRATSGRLGGTFRGAPVMLLTTTGRKSGKPRTTPVLYVRDGETLATVASNGGKARDPQWWSNLRANPAGTVQIKGQLMTVKSRKADPQEKERLWRLLTGVYPTYDEYQTKTNRKIPVVILQPLGPAT
jgi:deazaflavin-dependent oxidoreductase (nitroreductase family)